MPVQERARGGCRSGLGWGLRRHSQRCQGGMKFEAGDQGTWYTSVLPMILGEQSSVNRRREPSKRGDRL
jgi:hypothetical protein